MRSFWSLMFAFFISPAPAQADTYDVLLHSQSVEDQRSALQTILGHPKTYISRVQQTLRAYPRLLRSDPITAKRAVYLSALIRDPSFPAIMAKTIGLPVVLDECEYACPVIFAMTISARFGGWKIPENLDPKLTTVSDLKSSVANISRLTLQVGSIEDVVQGPALENYRAELEGKTIEQLIQLAGPATSSEERRTFAAFRLETMITDSKNRIDLYLLALNDFEDASGEYRGAIYQSIFRAELARSQGK